MRARPGQVQHRAFLVRSVVDEVDTRDEEGLPVPRVDDAAPLRLRGESKVRRPCPSLSPRCRAALLEAASSTRRTEPAEQPDTFEPIIETAPREYA